jgi:phosphoglycerate dehydrogenase-like enzyme
MEKINVLILPALSKENLRRIASVSPRLNVIEASYLTTSEPGRVPYEIKDATSQEKLNELLTSAEIVLAYNPGKDLVIPAPKLKWIQNILAGSDRLLAEDPRTNPGYKITNTSGIHGPPGSELVLEMMLMLSKQANFYFENKQQRKWQVAVPSLLYKQTVGIVGLGGIGIEIARLCRAFNMKVIATRRSARSGSHAKYVDVLYPRAQLSQIIKESDFLVMAVPSTPDTINMISTAEFNTMKPTAFLINIGRGNTVDEEALIHALETKRIAGAGLDVFTVEPLPPTSRLWDLPNAIIIPHRGGQRNDYHDAMVDIFCKNLERYVAGRRLINLVNRKRGY